MPQDALRRSLAAQSPAMIPVVEAIQKAALSELPVLLEGEAGTGKEFLARYIHYTGKRQKSPFTTLRVTSMPPELVERELYGHKTGGLRKVQGGTLLLKELWALPRAPQKRLARMMNGCSPQSETLWETFDVRVMTTSSMELKDASSEVMLESSLFDALSHFHVKIPPLRRRPADIPILTEYFVRQFCAESGQRRPSLDPRVMDRLSQHSWPGNISELKSVVRQLLMRAEDNRIKESGLNGLLPAVDDELPLDRYPLEELIRAKLKGFLNRIKGYRIEGLHAEVIARVERPLLELVLAQTEGNQLQAAKILGMNRNTLRKKIKQHNIRLFR